MKNMIANQVDRILVNFQGQITTIQLYRSNFIIWHQQIEKNLCCLDLEDFLSKDSTSSLTTYGNANLQYKYWLNKINSLVVG